MLTIGIDVHSRTHSICVLDDQGKILRQQTVRGGHAALAEQVEAIGGPAQVAFEASLDAGALFDRLRELPTVDTLVVLHPGSLRKERIKSDRIDAAWIARATLMGFGSRVHMPDPETRQWRRLVEFRCRTVENRTSVKNALRSLLRSLGIVPPRGLWSREGRAWLRTVELPDMVSRTRRRHLLRLLRLLDGQVKDIGKQLDRMGRRDVRVDLLRTIPGVGRRTAEALVAWIDDPTRFERSRRAGTYFGLVPSLSQSGSRSVLGSITKSGPRVVRWLLVEAAWRAVRKEGPLRERYLRLMRNDPQRKRKAVVAIARHLSVLATAILRDGKPYQDGTPATAREAATTA